MAVSKWQAASATPVTVLTTELNNLANDFGAMSAVLTTTRDQFANLELVVTFASTPVADRTVDVYIVRTLDGTTFEDATASRPPASGFLGSFAVNNVATEQRLILSGVSLDVRNFKLLVVNKSGVAFSASGNTLRMFPFSPSVE